MKHPGQIVLLRFPHTSFIQISFLRVLRGEKFFKNWSHHEEYEGHEGKLTA